jgi:hypothetical protein
MRVGTDTAYTLKEIYDLNVISALTGLLQSSMVIAYPHNDIYDFFTLQCYCKAARLL